MGISTCYLGLTRRQPRRVTSNYILSGRDERSTAVGTETYLRVRRACFKAISRGGYQIHLSFSSQNPTSQLTTPKPVMETGTAQCHHGLGEQLVWMEGYSPFLRLPASQLQGSTDAMGDLNAWPPSCTGMRNR
ncbi:hypothetical protein CISG_08862 [Coccidioides immitis RMSCC 3703]|uniref:Uncharacterized protein n=1 Tax=Coccidioides immitis RMSCC 3703 TaxID=454286 RepID=A0A0J8RAU6_COCIT|nr:hypothetical protein CISG_08862 [Coccidioides immitis RMSCC 3703]